jgi:hypothetical protein
VHDPFETDVHTFFIPVMGIGFTVDTPLRVAKYGISSVISLVDDVFLDQMRKFHSEKAGLDYEELPKDAPHPRAHRVTAYLNLLDILVKKGVEELQASPFEPGSEITRYYELLPEGALKQTYTDMLASEDPAARAALQEELRQKALPGSIDVNIMTKMDRPYYRNGDELPPEYADAMAALRGYANSTLNSSIVFSAGLNPRLYSYLAQFDDFFPNESGAMRKKIILKVSDYRSAVVQGKFLAKRGLWVSEYRVESGLNCGGHAFPARGYLMGPILDEFKQKREELVHQTHEIYTKALESRGPFVPSDPHDVRITVAGGIGTNPEHEFLLRYYDVDKAGWGTPFLLVPEVTNVDDEHLEKLCRATAEDVFLSAASPLKVPFWNLWTSASEELRRKRIEEGRPGSPCPKGHAKLFNTEFTEKPDCLATRTYVKNKLGHLPEEDLTEAQRAWVEEDVLATSCICHDLSGGATVKNNIDPEATPAICCGPGIVNFSKVASLEEMISHIYGRISLLTSSDRPHMFITEISIYIDYLKKEMEKFSLDLMTNAPKYFQEMKQNLNDGIDYYFNLAEQFVETKRKRFLEDLKAQKEAVENLFASLPGNMLTEEAG